MPRAQFIAGENVTAGRRSARHDRLGSARAGIHRLFAGSRFPGRRATCQRRHHGGRRPAVADLRGPMQEWRLGAIRLQEPGAVRRLRRTRVRSAGGERGGIASSRRPVGPRTSCSSRVSGNAAHGVVPGWTRGGILHGRCRRTAFRTRSVKWPRLAFSPFCPHLISPSTWSEMHPSSRLCESGPPIDGRSRS